MRRTLWCGALLAAATGLAAPKAKPSSVTDGGSHEGETLSLLRTDDGGTHDGGATFNGFALGSAVHAKGDLSKDDIRGVVEAHRDEIDACYGALLKRKAKQKRPPQGTAKLKFEVAPDGTVASASVGPGGLDEAGFVTCVVDHVRKWKFPLPQGGGPVKVAYPVLLEPE